MTNINRYVGWKEETTFGTEATIPMAVDLADGLASMALTPPKDPNIPLPTLARVQRRHIPGFYSPAGTMEYSADVNTIGWMLKWGLGAYTFTAGTGTLPNIHEFYVMPGQTLPSFTTRVGKDTFEHVFLGTIISKIDLSIGTDLMTGKIDLIAQQDKQEAIRTSLNTPDQDIFPLAFFNGTITLDGTVVSQNVQNWDLTHDNGVKATDGQGMGSRFPYSFRTGGATPGLTLTMKDYDSGLLQRYWGGVNGPSSGSMQTPFVLDSYFDSGAFGNMDIMAPRVTISDMPTDIKGADPRIPQVAFQLEATNVTLNDGVTQVNTPILVTIKNYEPQYALSTTMPVANFTGTPLTGVHPLAVTFTNTSTGDNDNFEWNFGDGSDVVTIVKSPTHTYAKAGTYTVTLTVFNSVGIVVSTKTAYVTVT
jgi:PKD repeat protein